MGSIREVEISFCPKLESYNCPKSIEKLKISGCGSMTSVGTLTPMVRLQRLEVRDCDNLEVNWVFSNFLSSLGTLTLHKISNVRLFPEGCLVHLTQLVIRDCDNIKCIPEKGFGFLPILCLRSLTIVRCKNIKSFPHEHLQSLTSLEVMWIVDCPSMEDSFPSGLWPPNLSFLHIGELKKGMSEWGIQHFPSSLDYLSLKGSNSGVVRFAAKAEEEEEERDMRKNNTSSSLSSFLLPSSLTTLDITNFDELESVRKDMEHLTCLEQLSIIDCPKLRDLPETLLPSLSCLSISNPSPELSKKCSRTRKGEYWPTISEIPDFTCYGLD